MKDEVRSIDHGHTSEADAAWTTSRLNQLSTPDIYASSPAVNLSPFRSAPASTSYSAPNSQSLICAFSRSP
jgi:hypothetical protein